LRLTELARTAGLSVQQIRNYVALGFLPPVERAPNGYRVFTQRHADALVVARTLITGYGWQTALTVMRTVHSGDPIPALTVVDGSHAELDHERTQVKATLEAFDGELPERYIACCDRYHWGRRSRGRGTAVCPAGMGAAGSTIARP
jgi:DNA-binding transcriptional MerR regulator